jgi:hypothetical protein
MNNITAGVAGGNQETASRSKKLSKQLSPQIAKNSLAEGSTHINTHDMI